MGDLFTDSINKDVQLYLEISKRKLGCVLLFPPVDNHKRFLIHHSIENRDDLCSFSIGQGDQRRTVISDKENLIKAINTPTSPATGTAASRERSKDKRRPDRPVYVPRARIQQSQKSPLKEEPSSTMPKKGEKPASEQKKTVPEEDPDDDWESMFADDGECLNPDMMKELTAAVAKVHIVPAANVTSVVQEEFTDEFAHVVEVSNFPAEFQTQDLMMLFMPYKSSGFEIKWVDDTHALVIFSSAKIASEVMLNKYPGVKLKRMSEASDESKGRARRSGATMQPYKARPQTSAALARRLVTGALGVKSKATKEQLENERRILKEAKERKRLAQKEQKDLWDDDEEVPAS